MSLGFSNALCEKVSSDMHIQSKILGKLRTRDERHMQATSHAALNCRMLHGHRKESQKGLYGDDITLVHFIMRDIHRNEHAPAEQILRENKQTPKSSRRI